MSHPTISSSVVRFSSCLRSFPASGSFPVSRLFTSGGQSYWSFSFSISPSNEYSGLISFRIHWFPCCPRDSESSATSQLKSISSLALSILYGPTLTSVHSGRSGLFLWVTKPREAGTEPRELVAGLSTRELLLGGATQPSQPCSGCFIFSLKPCPFA